MGDFKSSGQLARGTSPGASGDQAWPCEGPGKPTQPCQALPKPKAQPCLRKQGQAGLEAGQGRAPGCSAQPSPGKGLAVPQQGKARARSWAQQGQRPAKSSLGPDESWQQRHCEVQAWARLGKATLNQTTIHKA